MPSEYRKPRLSPLSFNFHDQPASDPGTAITLSPMDVLGIVHAAFEAIDPDDPGLRIAKFKVLEEVATGRLAHALRDAIVAAGQPRS